MTVFLALVATFLLQALVGVPGAPGWMMDVILPAPWLIVPILLDQRVSVFSVGLGLGLAWDLVTGSVVGPGAIAWSATGLMLEQSSQFIADRSPLTWGAFGSACAASLIAVRGLALVPLGLDPGWGWIHLVRSALLTGVLCTATGWTIRADLTARWVAYRRRRLR